MYYFPRDQFFVFLNYIMFNIFRFFKTLYFYYYCFLSDPNINEKMGLKCTLVLGIFTHIYISGILIFYVVHRGALP